MTDQSDTPSEPDRTGAGIPTDTGIPIDTGIPTDTARGAARGDPIGCNPSLEELYRYMDGFLDAEQLARIQSHIDACGGCGDLYHFQAGLRHLVGMRCRQAEFPPDLPKRIFGAITDL